MQPQAFDTYAKDYDAHFTNSLIGKAQRLEVYRQSEKYISFNSKKVLEINCGTGEDAVWMAGLGASVMATDISEGMLRVTEQKKSGLAITTRQLSSRDIGTLSPEKFDLIFSNFGGLNCLSEKELNDFKNGCVQLQNKSGKLAFVIMGTKCWWERFYYNRKKDPVKAKRRLNKAGTETVMDGNHFKTWYYSPDDIRVLFNNDYKHVTTKPIGLFVPPSYLEHIAKKRKVLFGLLKLMDALFGNFSFLADRADHYLIVFEKK
jgi:SAM-dependent methyltransferase